MKRITTTLVIILALATAVIAQQTETRKLDNFSAISVGEAIELVLVPGNKNEAKIKADTIG